MSNATLEVLMNRKSVRDYENRPIEADVRQAIVQAALRAPTAGNMMLYSIIEVKDQEKKKRLVETCDHQPFIAKAPLVLLFLADYQRWYDYFSAGKVPELCREQGKEFRMPREGDLFLACSDALIAAQNAVIAAEALGVGSCYIGDILENCEAHREMFALPPWAFPITMLCFGYPTQQQKERPQPKRFGENHVVFSDVYRRLPAAELEEMHQGQRTVKYLPGAENLAQHMYLKKVGSPFSVEMSRSAKSLLEIWLKGEAEK